MGLKPRPRSPARPATEIAGLPSRRIAAQALVAVLARRRPLDEALDPSRDPELAALSVRDRALVRMLVATTLRRLGTLRALVAEFAERGLPKDAPLVEPAIILGAAQILFLDVPDHAAVDLSVRVAASERGGRYAGFVNALLRRFAREGRARLTAIDDGLLDTPPWLLDRWQRNYGRDTAAAIAAAHRAEPPLDLTVKRDPALWAEKLSGRALPTSTVRLAGAGPIPDLPGYADGAWWVQDAAASLPARLLGEVEDLRVADLCAAPGGKTAQLAAAGARVVAVDRSRRRLQRVRENLARLKLDAEMVVADAAAWRAAPFDAVLLDAPCSATGTIRRHPDIPWQKRAEDIAALVDLQRRLLDNAAELTKPGGLLVYATCSLEPEECAEQIARFLAQRPDFTRVPIAISEIGGLDAVSADGDLRTLPTHLSDSPPPWSGCDGFYAARLRRVAPV